MTTKPQRMIAAFFAALFLISSSAFTVAVIWQATQSNKSNDSTTPATNTTKDKKVANQLQGTQLTNFTPGTPIPQLKTDDTTPGTGQEVKPGDTVTVDYTGAVAATGTIFQSSKDSGQTVPLQLKKGSVIDGFAEGVPGMKVGGTRRIFIPAAQAYGAQSPDPSIPPNADLVFDVTVHKIGK